MSDSCGYCMRLTDAAGVMRQIRLWVGESQSKALEAQHSDFASSADNATGMMKGCVRKEFCPDAVVETETDVPTIPGDEGSARSSRRQADSNVVAFLGDMLSETKPTDARSRDQQEKQSVSEAALDAVATHVPKDSNVLVLDSQPDLSWTRAMLQRGYANVYTLKKRSEGVPEPGTSGESTPKVSLELRRFRSADPTAETKICGTIEVKSLLPAGPVRPENSDHRGESVNVSVLFSSCSSAGLARLTHVIDAGFLYRGFRSQPKNSVLFRNVCHLLELIALECSPQPDGPRKQVEPIALVSVTGAKAWRKKEYFGHPAFGYTVSTAVLDAAAPTSKSRSKSLVVFNCLKGSAKPSKSFNPDVSELHEALTRDRVLALKRALESDFAGVKHSLQPTGDLDTGPITAKDAIVKIAEAVSEAATTTTRRHFVVTGKIARIRRFSHGMAFVSLVDAGEEETQGKRAHDIGLQIFIHQKVLEGRSPSVPFAELVPLFRRGDQVTVVGFARTSDRGREMLAALAVKFEAGGEFEAF